MSVKFTFRACRVNANLGTDEARKELGKLLKRPPMSRSTLWGYETGKVIPPVDVVMAMSKLYGIPVEMMQF